MFKFLITKIILILIYNLTLINNNLTDEEFNLKMNQKKLEEARDQLNSNLEREKDLLQQIEYLEREKNLIDFAEKYKKEYAKISPKNISDVKKLFKNLLLSENELMGFKYIYVDQITNYLVSKVNPEQTFSEEYLAEIFSLDNINGAMEVSDKYIKENKDSLIREMEEAKKPKYNKFYDDDFDSDEDEEINEDKEKDKDKEKKSDL